MYICIWENTYICMYKYRYKLNCCVWQDCETMVKLSPDAGVERSTPASSPDSGGVPREVRRGTARTEDAQGTPT